MQIIKSIYLSILHLPAAEIPLSLSNVIFAEFLCLTFQLSG